MRQFSGGIVTAARDGRGNTEGSKIRTAIGTVFMPHYPSRIKDVRPAGIGDLVVVETRKGKEYVFGPDDVIKEGGFTKVVGTIQETKAGGSMGGQDPRAHGKIRYIVRAFGSWARGKHHICVRRLTTEHPELVAGRDANALCAWLKDQWAGTTKWRGRGSDPKQKAEDLAIEKTARATAYARFTHAMPELTHAELDLLTEQVRTLSGQGIGALLRELGAKFEEGADPFVALFEHDAMAAELAVRECERLLKAGEGDPMALVESWLAVHGDHEQVNPQRLKVAVNRIVTHSGPLYGRTAVDQRVWEAQMREKVTREPWDRPNDDQTASRTVDQSKLLEGPDPLGEQDSHETSAEKAPPSVVLPPPAGGSRMVNWRAADTEREAEIGELRRPDPKLVKRPAVELKERLRGLYERSAEPTAAGRAWIENAGNEALARVLPVVEAAFRLQAAPLEEAELEELRERDARDHPIATSDTSRARGDNQTHTAGAPAMRRLSSQDVTDVGTLTPDPPNLRPGGARLRCGNCFHFNNGICEGYNEQVAEGEFCDSYFGWNWLNENAADVNESSIRGLERLQEAGQYGPPVRKVIAQAMKQGGGGTRVNVGPSTQNRGGKNVPVKGYVRFLQTGSSGAYVRSLQHTLSQKMKKIDLSGGTYNAQTTSAVRSYQRQHGLQVDGVVGTQTLSALRGQGGKKVDPGKFTKADSQWLKRNWGGKSKVHEAALAEGRVLTRISRYIRRSKTGKATQVGPYTQKRVSAQGKPMGPVIQGMKAGMLRHVEVKGARPNITIERLDKGYQIHTHPTPRYGLGGKSDVMSGTEMSKRYNAVHLTVTAEEMKGAYELTSDEQERIGHTMRATARDSQAMRGGKNPPKKGTPKSATRRVRVANAEVTIGDKVTHRSGVGFTVKRFTPTRVVVQGTDSEGNKYERTYPPSQLTKAGAGVDRSRHPKGVGKGVTVREPKSASKGVTHFNMNVNSGSSDTELKRELAKLKKAKARAPKDDGRRPTLAQILQNQIGRIEKELRRRGRLGPERGSIQRRLGERAVRRSRNREAGLTMAERKAIPSSQYVFPDRAPAVGAYPIHDRKHGGIALAFAKGRPEEATVRAKVCRKYPDLPSCRGMKEAELIEDVLRELGSSWIRYEDGSVRYVGSSAPKRKPKLLRRTTQAQRSRRWVGRGLFAGSSGTSWSAPALPRAVRKFNYGINHPGTSVPYRRFQRKVNRIVRRLS
jgi:peptidoglycan hydrolase-like protein with peptidoglycan-binding domain